MLGNALAGVSFPNIFMKGVLPVFAVYSVYGRILLCDTFSICSARSL